MDTYSSESDEDVPLAQLRYENIPLAQLTMHNNGACSKETEAKDHSISDDDEMSSDVNYESDRDPEFNPGTCEVGRCKKEVWAACTECEIMLCHDHFVEEIPSCNKHGKVFKEMKKKQNSLRKESVDFQMDTTRTSQSVSEHLVIIEGGLETLDQAVPEQFVVEGSGKEIQGSEKRMKRHNKQKEAKSRRNNGLDYTSTTTKKQVKAREVKPRCKGTTCSKKCSTITDEQRFEIFQAYWALGELGKQREFVIRHVAGSGIKRKRTGIEESRRKQTMQYTLTVNQIAIPVCKVFFHNTLGISEQTTKTAMMKMTTSGILEKEKRGGRASTKVIARDDLINEKVSKHIDRFPRVESHFCRASSSREYLHPGLTKKMMYSMFLKEWTPRPCPPSYSLYKKVFRTKNLSLHRPKKDQCSLCTTYRSGDQDKKEELQARYTKHNAEKEKSRELKAACKTEASDHNSIRAACFDLQQVIYLPISNENALFYKRRLCTFNFTVYDLSDKNCHCFTWHESESKRGASEISTAVHRRLKMYDDEGVKTVFLFADGCSGQNKNSILPAMMLYTVNNSINLEEVSLRFFESFHGQNEGDSAHSAIQNAIKPAGNLYQPPQLLPVFSLARPAQPYVVHQLQFDDFLDFKSLSKDLRILDARRDSNGDEFVQWDSIMELRIRKEHPTTIFYKTSHLQDEFKTISLKRLPQNIKNFKVAKLNTERKKISKEKYNDLLSLCSGETPVIRAQEHKNFYLSLPHD